MRIRFPGLILTLLAAAMMAPGPARADFAAGARAQEQGDYATAIKEWQPLADGGDAAAQYALGYLTFQGLGIATDQAKAADWYQKAAAQNYPDALFALGLMSEGGWGVAQDLTKAIDFYRKAAATGPHAEAEYTLGRLYYRGRGVTRDMKQAVAWFKKAAAKGHPGAQYMLGGAYETGEGVGMDLVQSYFWYFRAAHADQRVLQGYEPAFDPRAALVGVQSRMSGAEIEQAMRKAETADAGARRERR